jgi:hypothetical protein
MKRRWFAVIGGFFLVVAALAGALLGSAVLRSPRLAIGIVAWLLVGDLAVVGGLRESAAGVAWYRFVGASDVLWGCGWSASPSSGTSRAEGPPAGPSRASPPRRSAAS